MHKTMTAATNSLVEKLIRQLTKTAKASPSGWAVLFLWSPTERAIDYMESFHTDLNWQLMEKLLDMNALLDIQGKPAPYIPLGIAHLSDGKLAFETWRGLTPPKGLIWPELEKDVYSMMEGINAELWRDHERHEHHQEIVSALPW
jgi:hypothetical protein